MPAILALGFQITPSPEDPIKRLAVTAGLTAEGTPMLEAKVCSLRSTSPLFSSVQHPESEMIAYGVTWPQR
jgi:hypothetical protein